MKKETLDTIYKRQHLQQKTTEKSTFTIAKEIEIIKEIGNKFVKEFIIDSNNQKIIEWLINYFNTPQTKGIFLRGGIGSGKTLLMEIFSIYSQYTKINPFKIVIPGRDIAQLYSRKGFEGILKYTQNPSRDIRGNEVDTPNIICIDDIGTEGLKVKYFGMDVNIIYEVLLTRYDIYSKIGTLTHITTNVLPSEVKKNYGDKIFSRLKEMCFDVIIDGNDRRK